MGSTSSAPTESPLDSALANIGQQQYAHYQAKFVPLQKYAISQNLNPASAIQQAHSATNADYQQSFQNNAGKISSSQGAASGGAGTGRQVLGLAGGSLDQGQALGLGQGGTQVQTQKQLATNLQNLMNIGQGQGAQAVSSLGSAASVANKQAATDSAVSAASRSALLNAAGTFTGMKLGNTAAGGNTNYYGMFAQSQSQTPNSGSYGVQNN